jgi:dTDP-4-amino-4,6-dideoxygalactose transaminase
MTALSALGRRYGVPVVEDAAHAFPAKTRAGYAGTLGDVGVFSFYATKTITTGEGGMVYIRDPALAARFARLRSHGIDRPVWDRYTSNKASWEYDITDLGWKANLPDILAALGRVQLTKAETMREKRSAICARFNDAFSHLDFLRVPPDGDGNAWHLYLLRIVPEKLTIDRGTFSRRLQERGLGVSMHFIPHFHFTWFKKNLGISAPDYPHAQAQAACTITLPLWPDMTGEMVSAVIDAVVEVGEGAYGG